eukprot:gene7781-10516_t
MTLRLFGCVCGQFHSPGSAMGMAGQRVSVPVPFYVIEHPGGVAAERLEAAILAEAGLTTDVLIRDAAQIRAVVSSNPFLSEAAEAPSRLMAMFLSAEPPAGLEALASACVAGEQVRAGPQCLYIHYPGGAGSSKPTGAHSAGSSPGGGTVTAQYLDSVNVPPPGLLPALWAPVGLRYHALHHLLPSVPYHALGGVPRCRLALSQGQPSRPVAAGRQDRAQHDGDPLGRNIGRCGVGFARRFAFRADRTIACSRQDPSSSVSIPRNSGS